MVQYRRKQKQKLRKRSRRTNRNNYSSIQNNNVRPYMEFDQLNPEEKNFIFQYVSTPDDERGDLNIQLAKMKNKDEIWYNIWHQEKDPNNFLPEVTIVPAKPNGSQISESLYFNDFNTNKNMIDYQDNYYKQHGFFDYSQPFIGYNSIGSYMDINKLSSDNLYKLLEQYYSNK